jgi:hypothetical protein
MVRAALLLAHLAGAAVRLGGMTYSLALVATAFALGAVARAIR